MKPPFQAYSGSDPFIFVCYAHEDKELVYAELSWLKDQGVNIWYDEGIAPGEEWPERIAWAVANAEKFLFYISPGSATSRVCRDEVNLASSEGKPIISVLLKPTKLVGGLKLTLGTSQAIVRDHFRRPGDYQTQLLSTILTSSAISLESESRKSLSPVHYIFAGIVLAMVGTFAYLQSPLNEDVETPISDFGSELRESSIAILPLADMSPAGDLEFLCDGMAVELIHGLAQIPGVNVIARTSSFYFKDQNMDVQSIGRSLGVETVLVGSVQREDDQLKITLQLINVEDGFHIWSQQYSGLMGDIFSVQEDIVQNVVTTLLPEFDNDNYNNLTEAGTNSALAYEAYLLGKHELSQVTLDSMDRAIAQFRLAIEYDPEFVRAYTELISAYDAKGRNFGNRDEMMSLAADVLEQVKIQDPDRQLTNWYWIEQFFFYEGDISLRFREAEALYNLMIRERSHPANGGHEIMGYFQYSVLLAKSGLFDAALAFMAPLESIEPMHGGLKLRLGQYYAAVSEYENALSKFNDLLVLDPYNVYARIDKYLILGKLGRFSEAGTVRDELASALSADLVGLLDAYFFYWRGDTDSAIALLDQLSDSEFIPVRYIGTAYLSFGEFDKGLSFLELASDQADVFASEIILTQTRTMSEEQWLSLRDNARFKSFMARFQYDDSWPDELASLANELTPITRVTVRND